MAMVKRFQNWNECSVQQENYEKYIKMTSVIAFQQKANLFFFRGSMREPPSIHTSYERISNQ